MTNRELAAGVRRICWGYLLIFLNFNLIVNDFSLDLLNNTLGWGLVLSGIRAVKGEQPTLGLLENFSLWLVIWTAAEQLVPALENVPLLPLVVRLVVLYFHFQLFTDLGELAERRLFPGRGNQLRRLRTALVVLDTFVSFTGVLLTLPEWLTVAVLLATLVAALWSALELWTLASALERTNLCEKPE